MAGKPPTDDGKSAPKKPGKAFDPKAEDWQKRGRANFVDRKQVMTGPPISPERLRKIVAKRVARL